MAEVFITWRDGTIDELPVEPYTHARSRPEGVRRALLHLHPTRTPANHQYEVRDPIRGRGTAEVFGLGPDDLHTLTEMIHVIEICRRIGRDEPLHLDGLPDGLRSVMLRIPNPYLQLATAGVMLGIGGTVVWIAFFGLPHVSFISFVMLFLALQVIALAVWVGFRAWKRRAWWHAARAHVKRDGEKMPELLRAFR